MSKVIVLDSGPVGFITNPGGSPAATACRNWMMELLSSDVRVILPEIIDYEIRRELLRAKKTVGISRLDALKALLEYIPLTSSMLLLAAEFWASGRQQGRPTADHKALDIDVILAAQAVLSAAAGDDLIIATTNPGHLSLFVDARVWHDI